MVAKRDELGVKDAFAIAYTEDLFAAGGIQATLYDDSLEADDCIAITVRYLEKKYPGTQITIITSDMDYLQLASERTRIFNLDNRELIKSSQSFQDAKKDLFCKMWQVIKVIILNLYLRDVVLKQLLNIMRIVIVLIAS